MRRDAKKEISKYKRLFGNESGNKGAFFYTDVCQILDMVKDSDSKDKTIAAIYNALMVGFMVGMRYGQRQKGGEHGKRNDI